MSPDPTLEALMAGGHFPIAADRYEEQTGDSELAALMRIDGLEWELVDGEPGLNFQVTLNPDLIYWWDLVCGTADFDIVVDDHREQVRHERLKPRRLEDTPIHKLLAESGLGPQFAERFYRLYLEAVHRVCAPDPSA
jgi:hypothetical protein